LPTCHFILISEIIYDQLTNTAYYNTWFWRWIERSDKETNWFKISIAKKNLFVIVEDHFYQDFILSNMLKRHEYIKINFINSYYVVYINVFLLLHSLAISNSFISIEHISFLEWRRYCHMSIRSLVLIFYCSLLYICLPLFFS